MDKYDDKGRDKNAPGYGVERMLEIDLEPKDELESAEADGVDTSETVIINEPPTATVANEPSVSSGADKPQTSA